MPHRIVSLISSATEIVVALGFGEQLVGRSHECDFPPWVQRLPKCSEPKIDIHAGSAAIDRAVKQLVGDGLSIYNVFVETLDQLAPTLVITQSQCEVCAVSLADVERALCGMVASQPRVVSLEPMDLDDVWRDIRHVAEVLGAPERGVALVESLQGRLQQVRNAVNGKPVRKVLCLEWLSPMMSAGNWVPTLAAAAVGDAVLARQGMHSPYFTWADLQAADPDVIAIMPCGFDIPRTRQELPCLVHDPRWRELRAVREQQVFLTDGNQYFNRPGPRLVDSAEILAELLHPECAPFPWGTHRDSGWVPCVA